MTGGGDSTNAAPRRPARPAFVWSLVAGLLVAHFVLANAAAWNKGCMFDEPSHIGGGVSFWKTGDYRMLALAIAQQRWMTLPIVLGGTTTPAPEGPIWERADNWGYGQELLYGLDNDSQRILRNARMMTSVWSVVLGLLTFVWTRRLFGTAGALVALVLYAFNPTVLAHAAAATNDMSSALAFTAAAYSLWLTLERLTTFRLVVSSLVWGLALAAKFSTVLLLPVAALMLVIHWLGGQPLEVRLLGVHRRIERRAWLLWWYAVIAVVHALVAWLVIWALFGFQFEMFREFPGQTPQPYLGTFDQLSKETGRYEPLLRFARDKRLLPEGYLYCFGETVRTTAGRSAFLDGWYGVYGFKSFFPLAFLYKTPPAFFLLLLTAGAAHLALRLRQMRGEGRKPLTLLWEGFYATAPLWGVLAVYGATSILGPLNLGIRHILPMFAPGFILCGVVGLWFTRLAESPAQSSPPPPLVRLARWSAIGCVALYAVDTASTYPDYLAYFNIPSGGIDEGHKHLVDSSLDWGQELPALRDWLDEQGVLAGPSSPRIYAAYFGTASLSAAGLRPTPLTCYFDVRRTAPGLQDKFEPTLSPGLYCVSATMLQSVYIRGYNGPWRQSYENRYRELLPHVGQLAKTADDAKARNELLAQHEPSYWMSLMDEIERARTARLMAYLRTRPPLHIVSGAILIYKLSAADLTLALDAEIPVRPDPKSFGDPIPY